MTKWEYTTSMISVPESLAQLQEMGDQGWELCWYGDVIGVAQDRRWVIFKRHKVSELPAEQRCGGVTKPVEIPQTNKDG